MTLVKEASHVAACRSRKVWQRLLRWRLRKLQGFVCKRPARKANEGSAVAQMWRVTAVNVGACRRARGGWQ